MTPPSDHICAALQLYADRDLPDAVVDVDDDATTAPPSPPLSGRALVGAVAALGRALPLAPGDRCALLGETTSAYLVGLLAAVDAGAVACPLNWRWSAEELARALAAVAPRAVLADAPLLPLLQRALALLLPPPPSLPPPPQQQQHQQQHQGPAIFVLARDARDPSALRAAARAGTTTTAALAAALSRASSSSPSPPLGLQLRFAPSSSCSPPAAGPSVQDDIKSSSITINSSNSSNSSSSNTKSSNSPDALCVFTSGTTAAPKPARLSHAALWHQSRAKLAVVGYGPQDVYLHLAPLFHVGGISSAHAALAAGARHALLPRFSAGAAAAAIQRLRVTALIAVPAMLSDLLDAAEEERGRRITAPRAGAAGPGKTPPSSLPPLASLRKVLLGAGAASPELLRRCLGALPRQAALLGAYGMTEGCSSLTFADLRVPLTPAAAPAVIEAAGYRGGAFGLIGLVCVGRAAPGVELAIAAVAEEEDEEDEEEENKAGGRRSSPKTLRRAPPGVVGEVLTRGPHLMSGYHLPQVDRTAALEADAAAFARLSPPPSSSGSGDGGENGNENGDGGGLWLRTGDAGVLALPPPPPSPNSSQPPLLYLAGRLKECIRSGGENVFSPEVEAALRLHPAVEQAAAAGLPHARLGEAVAAVVVLRDGWDWRGGADAMAAAVQEDGEAAAGRCGGVVSAAALRAFCVAARLEGGAGLSRFKAPRAVAAMAALPRDPLTGKIARKEVREALLRTLGEERGATGRGGAAASAAAAAAAVPAARSRL